MSTVSTYGSSKADKKLLLIAISNDLIKARQLTLSKPLKTSFLSFAKKNFYKFYTTFKYIREQHKIVDTNSSIVTISKENARKNLFIQIKMILSSN